MLFRPCIWLLVVVLSPALFASGTPNIVLITIDTARADRMGFLGWDGG